METRSIVPWIMENYEKQNISIIKIDVTKESLPDNVPLTAS